MSGGFFRSSSSKNWTGGLRKILSRILDIRQEGLFFKRSSFKNWTEGLRKILPKILDIRQKGLEKYFSNFPFGQEFFSFFFFENS